MRFPKNLWRPGLHKFRRGFTLVELLVAIALFSILVSVAVGGFAQAQRTERQISSLMAAESNVSLAIEQAAREIRTGSEFCLAGQGGASLCGSSVADPITGAPAYQSLAFVNAENATVIYAAENGVLMKSADGGATFSPLTADTVSIPYFTAEVSGNTAGDHWTPRITLNIGVASKDPALVGQVLHLQTTVSARAIDCDTGGNC